MREIIVFGASHLIAELDLEEISFIVDNNPDLQGTSHYDLIIKSPEVLNGASERYEVIVCSTSIGEIKSQLESYGYTWGLNAGVYKALKEREKISDIEDRSSMSSTSSPP